MTEGDGEGVSSYQDSGRLLKKDCFFYSFPDTFDRLGLESGVWKTSSPRSVVMLMAGI